MFLNSPFFFYVRSSGSEPPVELFGPGVGGGANGHGGIPGGDFSTGSLVMVKGPKFKASLTTILPDITDTYPQAFFASYVPSKIKSGSDWIDDVTSEYSPNGKIGSTYYAYSFSDETFLISSDLESWTDIGAPSGFSNQYGSQLINDGTTLALIYVTDPLANNTYTVSCVTFNGVDGWGTPSTIRTGAFASAISCLVTGVGKFYVKTAFPDGNRQYYSTDSGATWTYAASELLPEDGIWDIAFVDSTFYYSYDGEIYSAPAVDPGDGGIVMDVSAIASLHTPSFNVIRVEVVNGIPVALGNTDLNIAYAVLDEGTITDREIIETTGTQLGVSFENPSTILYFDGVYYLVTTQQGDMLNTTSLTSPDWAYTLYPNRILVNEYLTSIVSDGDGTIIVTTDAGKVCVSDDYGLTWTVVDLEIDFNYLNCSAYGNGMFVVGGLDTIASSADGLTWNVTSETGSDTSAIAWAIGLNVFAAAGYNGDLHSSTDGTTWTQRATSDTYWYNLRWQKDRFIAVGEDSLSTGKCLAYSTDGETYSYPENFDDADILNDTAYKAAVDTWVAVGFNSSDGDEVRAYYSSDGALWTTAAFLPDSSPFVGRLASVIYTDQFVAVGEDENGNGIVITSATGATWSEPTIISESSIAKIEWTGNQYIAQSGDGVYASYDLIDWEQIELDVLGTSFSNILAVNGATVLIGELGTIAVTAGE